MDCLHVPAAASTQLHAGGIDHHYHGRWTLLIAGWLVKQHRQGYLLLHSSE
jgi:hypothetical protein